MSELRAEDKVWLMETAGFKVEIRHGRRQKLKRPQNSMAGIELNPKGGVTTCQVLLPEGQGESVYAVGHAYCREEDNFNRRIGFEIAVGRAYKEWEEHRSHA